MLPYTQLVHCSIKGVVAAAPGAVVYLHLEQVEGHMLQVWLFF